MNKKRILIFFSLIFLSAFIFLLISVSALDWPSANHDTNNTNYQDEVINAAALKPLWSSSNASVFPVLIAGGRLYASSSGGIYSANATNGTLNWVVNYGSSNYGSGPVFSNGVIYIVLYNSSNKPIMTALNATNGTTIWNSSALPSAGYGSVPAVLNGIVYITVGNYGIYAINATNGSKIWNFSSEYMDSSPIVYNGTVYVQGNGPSFYALNATDGSVIWHDTMSNTAASLYDGILYAGNTNNITAFYPNGTSVWNFTSGSLGGLAISDGVVYAGTYSNLYAYALNATNGNQIWNYTTGSSGFTGFQGTVASIGVVFFVANNGYIHALNATSGNLIFKRNMGGFGRLSLSNGMIFFTGTDLVALGINSSYVATCDTVSSCNIALENALPGDTIYMNQSIDYAQDGIAIDFEGINNVTFDCAGFYLTGPNTINASNSGIYLNNSNYTSVKNCNISKFYSGVVFNNSYGSVLLNSNVSSNIEFGAFINYGSNNTLQNLILNSEGNYGAYLLSTSNNLLRNVTANLNFYGVSLRTSSNNTIRDSVTNLNLEGVDFYNSTLNSIINLTATTSSSSGVSLSSSSNNNTIKESVISNSTFVGLSFSNSNYNLFYDNILNNTVNYFNSSSVLNYFNTTLTSGTNILGIPVIGGNYWDNYSAPGTGFSPTCTDSDTNGICDSGYSLDGLNYDYLPLSLTYTQSNPPPGPGGSAPPGSPGGSSGGGTTVASNVTVTIGRTTTTSGLFTNITAGTPVTFYTNTSAVGVSSITMTTNKTITNAIINVSAITRTSQADLRIKDIGTTYQSFRISTSKNLNDSVITNVTITFEVNKSWFVQNRLDPANLTLYRNTNTTPNRAIWTALPTTLLSQDSQYYYFSATSPGFSDYTIFANDISCNNGDARCILDDSQVCSSNTWILSQHCQLGCNADNGQCITTSREAVNFFQGVLNSFQSFINQLPGTLQLTVGSVTYYVLIVIVTSGAVIVSTILVRNAQSRRRIWKKK